MDCKSKGRQRTMRGGKIRAFAIHLTIYFIGRAAAADDNDANNSSVGIVDTGGHRDGENRADSDAGGSDGGVRVVLK